MVPLMFGGTRFAPLPEGALWWPAHRALLVADLHLEKGSAFAGRGMMLPPYDSVETLRRLGALIAATNARAVWCLGDGWHDRGGIARLPAAARALLAALTDATDWTWILGNHDPEIAGAGGRVAREACVDGIALRHEADPDDPAPEISGHFHPKLRVAARGRSIARRCFVLAPTKLMLPAFGAFAGGLDAADPAIRRAVGGPATAVLPAAGRLLRFALG